MGVEKESIKLAPFHGDLRPDGSLNLVRYDGEAFRVPAAYVPLLRLVAEGSTLSEIALHMRIQKGGWGRFVRLANFVGFLYDSGLLVENHVIQFAEALRADYTWRESLICQELFSIRLLRLKSSQPSSVAVGLVISVVLLGLSLAAALRVPSQYASMAARWLPLQTAWPLILAFAIVICLGRSLRSFVQLVLMRFVGHSVPSLRLRLEPISLSLVTNDASHSKMNVLYVLASFAALVSFQIPALFGPQLLHFGLVSEQICSLLPLMTLEVLLIELSPFRQSALTECLRCLFIFCDQRQKKSHETFAENFVRWSHVLSCSLWVIALGLFLAFASPELFKYVMAILPSDFSGSGRLVSVLIFVLLQTTIAVSFVDDIVSGIGDGGGSDRFSIRRLWLRTEKGATGAIGAEGRPSKAQMEDLPLLRQMDPQVRKALLENAKIQYLDGGEYACRQNEADRTLYILLTGRLQVVRRSSSGRKKVLAFLESGAVFGEVAFFFGDRRTADVVAIEDSSVLAIAHDDKLSNLDRTRSDELQLRIWFLQSLVASPLFKHLPTDALDALLFAGERRQFRAGEKIMTEGETGDVCYFIIQGQVSVSQNFKVINRLKAGDAFGEIALLKPELLRTASVTADSEILCVTVGGEKFWNLLSSHLPLAVEFEKLAEMRLRADAERGQS